MYYVCVENQIIISVLNYEPAVPPTVSVYQITDEEHDLVNSGSHIFDLTTFQVVLNPEFAPEQKEIEIQNAIERNYLYSTDWMILRHLRQQTLGIATTLTEDEFTDLETKRHEAALRIIS
jgi:hypothetical protein